MKKILSIFLLLCLSLTLCFAFTSCEAENVTPYTQLRDHLNGELTPGKSMVLENKAVNLLVYLWPDTTEGEGDPIKVTAEVPMGTGYTGHVSFHIYNQSTEYDVSYVVFETESKKVYHSAVSAVKATDYTGHDILHFDEINNINVGEEYARRQDVTAIFNATLTTLDTYLTSINLSVKDFGFDHLATKYLANSNPDGIVEEDLGDIFSGARWSYAGEMLLLGISMVFLVLAILWGILAIFAKTMGKNKHDTKKEQPAPKPTVVQAAPQAPAAVASDDAIVAAITAAIAMTIESDAALSEQFAGGFRVVSFKKKSGKNAWNH